MCTSYVYSTCTATTFIGIGCQQVVHIPTRGLEVVHTPRIAHSTLPLLASCRISLVWHAGFQFSCLCIGVIHTLIHILLLVTPSGQEGPPPPGGLQDIVPKPKPSRHRHWSAEAPGFI